MQVDRPRADRAAAGQRHPRLALAREQRPQHQHRGAHLAHDVVGRGGRVDLAGLQGQRRAVAVAVLAGGGVDLDAVLAQQRDHGGDVGQPRHVLERQRLVGEHRCHHQRQAGVLGARDDDLTLESVSSFDPDAIHTGLRQILGKVTPRWPWYLPALSR
jgi:hypothetical protein